MKRIVVGILVVLAVILAIVEFTRDTPERVVNRFKEPFSKKRDQLKKIAQALPAKVTIVENPTWAKLDPKPAYDGDKKIFNASLLMEEQLSDLNKDMKGIHALDLRSYDDLFVDYLQMTEGLDRKSWRIEIPTKPDDLSRQLQDALDRPYLIVVRTLRYEPPVLKGNTFTGAKAELEGFLFDLRSDKLVGSVRVSASPPALLKAFGEADIHKSLVYDAKGRIWAALSKATGG